MTNKTEKDLNEAFEKQESELATAPASEDATEPQIDLTAQLQEKDAKIAELEQALTVAKKNEAEAMVRAQAEIANIRKRLDQDVEKAKKFTLEKFSIALLDVVDNLERAIKTLDGSNEAHQLIIEGIELTLKSLLDTLKKFGIEPVFSTGEILNPDLHQAITMIDSPDHAQNQIVDTMQKGYTLNGRLIRPAMVIVAK